MRSTSVVRHIPAPGRNARANRTSSALLCLQLTRRHLDVLELLATHPLLSTAELGAVLDVASPSIARYLALLRGQSCVAAPVARPEPRFALTQQGLHLVARAHHVTLRRLLTLAREDGAPRVQRDLRALLRHLDHTAGVYGFFATLHRAASAARRAGTPQHVAWWESGSACARRFRYRQHWHNLRPDGSGAYEGAGRRVSFWLEWDRGTMGSRDLAEKWWAYRQYLASREWYLAGAPVPHLLVVAPEATREARLARSLSVLGHPTSGLTTWTTTMTALEQQGALAAIWRRWTPEGTPGMVGSPFATGTALQ